MKEFDNKNNKDDLFKSGSSEGGRPNLSDIKEDIKQSFNQSFCDEYNGGKVSVVGILVFVFFLVLTGLIILFSFIDKEVPLFICVGIFVATIVIFILYISIRERINLKKPNSNCTRRVAKVLGSKISSQKQTLKKVTIIYKVYLDLDGKIIKTYCRENLKRGRIVGVYVGKNPKYYCYIDINKHNEIYDQNELYDQNNY